MAQAILNKRIYVSDWSDLEGVNVGLLFDIYKVELLNKIHHGGSLALNDKPLFLGN